MRTPTPTVELSSRLQPIASPVDTYVRPATPSRSPLWEVAEGLGNLDRSLQGFLDQRREKDRETDRLRGEAAFWKDNSAGAAEGVRNGTIPPYASPSFMEGYKAAEGRTAGMKLAERFQVEYLQWPGKDSQDPAAFDQFFSEWVKNVTPDDPDVLRGLLPQLRALHDGASSQFTQDLAKNVYGGAIKSHSAEAASDIDKLDLDGRTRPEGTDYEAVWSALMAKRESVLATGVRAEDFDKELFTTIATKAIQHRDPGLLGLLDRSLPGQSTKISDSPEGLALKLDTESRLATLARTAEEEAEQKHRREAKEKSDAFARDAIEALSGDPNKPIPEEMLKEGSKWDPEYRTKVLGWQKTLLEGGVVEDPKALTQLYSDILAGGGMETVTKALENGVIRDQGTLREATNFVRSLKSDGENASTAKALKGRTFTAIMDAIRTRTAGSAWDPLDPGGISDEGLEAQVDYQRMLLDWATKNPDASEMDLEDARSRIGKAVLGGITENTQGEREYNPPQGSIGTGGGDNPFYTPPQKAEAPAPAQGDTPAAAEAQPNADLEAFKSSHMPEFRDRVENEAKRRGISPDVIWRAMQDLEAPAPSQPEAPAAGNPMGDQSALPEDGLVQLASYAPEIGTALDDAMAAADDLAAPAPQVSLQDAPPGVAQLLDHIGGIEAPKGYDQMFGERTPKHNLTSMSLDEVLALQSEKVRGGSASSAAGRYQFLRKTLRSLKQDLGLTGSEPFTPELQDRLALALMERRGLSKYLSGEWSATRFANSLAKEWASLPVVSGSKAGRSYYAGDGLNASLTSVQEILALVQGIRGSQDDPSQA
jgi:muramidase (phage lysozyme)